MIKATHGWVLAGATAYFLLPGYQSLPSSGMPLGPLGSAVVAAGCIATVLMWRVLMGRAAFMAVLGLLAAAAAGRVAIALTTPVIGWTASYFANDSWRGVPEWSSEFRLADGTRIDRTIDFENGSLPVHFLNGPAFPSGRYREVAEPLTVSWAGHWVTPAATTLDAKAEWQGLASVEIDGREIIGGSHAERRTISVPVPVDSGAHVLTVRYFKPAGQEAVIRVEMTDRSTGAPIDITPKPAPGPVRPSLFRFALVLDGLVAALLAGVSAYGVALRWRERDRRSSLLVTASAFLLFGVHGWLAASRFTGRFVTLSDGDDWWGFESRARNILETGPLMTLGQPLGAGAPYFYHPFYSYFLAGVHAVTGESLFGPIFVQFLILAMVTVVMWSQARALFGEWPAVAGVVALVLVFELDFARYYTVTLLSENLYILTVTLCLASFVGWVKTGDWLQLGLTGWWGGVSSITRPAMLVFFLPALACAAWVAAVRSHSLRPGLTAAAILAVAWLAVIAPVTARNWIVSSRPVLISEGAGRGFIMYNLPAGVETAPYLATFDGSLPSGLAALARIAWDHPLAMLEVQGRKAGFSLGMVHWSNGYRPHPELVLISALYGLMCIVSPTMRSSVLWPVHLFVIAHLASMGLTSPWNYGYRLILPPFVYTSTLSIAALVAQVLERRRRPALDVVAEAG